MKLAKAGGPSEKIKVRWLSSYLQRKEAMTTDTLRKPFHLPEWFSTVLVAAAAVGFWILALMGDVPFSGIEAAGFVTGAFSVWWSARNSVWGFPIGIANNIFYIIVFYENRYYADMTLQFVYIAFAAYGIYKWVWGNDKAPAPIRHITMKMAAAMVVFVGISTFAVRELLIELNGAAPFWDAFLSALSIGAMTLMVLRVFENWFVWITADIFYIWLFWTRDLPLTAVLYVVFMALCFSALYFWTKELKAQKAGKKLTVEDELRKV